MVPSQHICWRSSAVPRAAMGMPPAWSPVSPPRGWSGYGLVSFPPWQNSAGNHRTGLDAGHAGAASRLSDIGLIGHGSPWPAGRKRLVSDIEKRGAYGVVEP